MPVVPPAVAITVVLPIDNGDARPLELMEAIPVEPTLQVAEIGPLEPSE